MQTDATRHNIVSPTMLGVVGTCCMVRANECNNCQQCWRLSKEAIYFGIAILKKDCNAHAQRFSRGQHCCGSGSTLLRFASPVTEQWKYWDLLRQKFDRFQTIRNKCQQCCGSMQTDATCWVDWIQQCCVLLVNNVASVCMGLNSLVTELVNTAPSGTTPLKN